MTTFGADSTTDDVLDGHDLTGLRVLITGTSAGLGVETARALAAHGAQVTGVVRDLDKARRNLDEVGATGVELYQADLASLDSVRAFTDRFLADGHDRIDLLIANAGIMACPQGITTDGFELQFGTNHLGHFVLVNRLAPLLLSAAATPFRSADPAPQVGIRTTERVAGPAGPPARVVTLSSAGHRFSDVSLDDPNFERTPYDEWVAYGRAKTANVLFAVELDRRLRDRGVRATALHPGGILTELGRHLTDASINALLESRGTSEVEFKTVPQGAATTVWAGVVADADVVGGRFCEDCGVAPVVDDDDVTRGVRPYALDPNTAAALWTLSEQMVGETFDP